MEQSYSRIDFKISVIGNSGTGKTNFVSKYIDNIFNDTYISSLIAEFSFKILELDGLI